MAPEIVRAYHCKDVEVLNAGSSIVDNAMANLTEILTKRPLWANPYYPDLKARINTAFSTYLGVDSAADLRSKTSILLSVTAPAKAGLSTFKIGITEDYKKDKPRLNEILNLLGYTSLWKAVNNGDQEALIQLLFQFKTNMTPSLTTEVTTKGTLPALITSINAYAVTLQNANVSQEFAKSQRPLQSSEAVTEFNEIYSTVISTCKICRNIFRTDAIRRSNFSFSATVKRLNDQSNSTPPPPPSK